MNTESPGKDTLKRFNKLNEHTLFLIFGPFDTLNWYNASCVSLASKKNHAFCFLSRMCTATYLTGLLSEVLFKPQWKPIIYTHSINHTQGLIIILSKFTVL